MISLKNTERSEVQSSFDGKIHKRYRGDRANQRLENEVRVLRHLESRNCPFVPRLLSVDRSRREIVISHCGNPVEQISQQKARDLFDSLRRYGVIHGDPESRNITYRISDGEFYVIDFEFASLIEHEILTDLDNLQSQIELELKDANER